MRRVEKTMGYLNFINPLCRTAGVMKKLMVAAIDIDTDSAVFTNRGGEYRRVAES